MNLTKQKSPAEPFQEMQASFLQNVHHELRTPVAIILGYADLLREGGLGEMAAEQQRAIFAISNSAYELKKLVERITTLLIAQARLGVVGSLNMSEIVALVVKNQRSKTKKAKIILEFQPPPAPLQVMGDAEQLTRAIDCLIENAIKFNRPAGQVKVELTQEDEWVCLIVTDTGIGIAPDKLVHIFTPFYQIDGSTTRPYNGLGLGLALTKGVVEAHAGQIEVTSHLGQGSQFKIKLPLALLTSSDQPDDYKIAPRHILVVDDEKYITLMLKEALEEISNCEIITASTGEQALQLMETQVFDMLITDYRMPGIDGLTLAIRVREMHPHTAIIMLTAYSTDDLLQQAANISIQHVLNKPVKLSEIRQMTEAVLSSTTRLNG